MNDVNERGFSLLASMGELSDALIAEASGPLAVTEPESHPIRKTVAGLLGLAAVLTLILIPTLIDWKKIGKGSQPPDAPESVTSETESAETEPVTEPETEPAPPVQEKPVDIGIPDPTGKAVGTPLDKNGYAVLLDAKIPGRPMRVLAVPVKNGFFLVSCGNQMPGEEERGPVVFWSLSEDGTLTCLGKTPYSVVDVRDVFLNETGVCFMEYGDRYSYPITSVFHIVSLRDFSEIFALDVTDTENFYPARDGSGFYCSEGSAFCFSDWDNRVTVLLDVPDLDIVGVGPELGSELRILASTGDGYYDYYLDKMTGEILYSEKNSGGDTRFAYGSGTAVQIAFDKGQPVIKIRKSGNHLNADTLSLQNTGSIYPLPEAELLLEVAEYSEEDRLPRWNGYSLFDGSLLFSVKSVEPSFENPCSSDAYAGADGTVLSVLSLYHPEKPETRDDCFRFVLVNPGDRKR